MSTHPNVILLLILTPDDSSRKTHRAIMAECGVESPDDAIKSQGICDRHKCSGEIKVTANYW